MLQLDPSCVGHGSDYTFSSVDAGPLAACLVQPGYRVLLEAGGDDEPFNYRVPVFHCLATEIEAVCLGHSVRHYADTAQQLKDPEHEPVRNGVLYPCAPYAGRLHPRTTP